MTFTYPLGLLGLIAIPIIIVIYILRSKYTEQTVPSTYIWHLSDKFLKRRNPLSAITGLISLILQILTVAAISLAIARPVFTLPGAAKDYCFVLDSSGSMNMIEGRESRFEKAKDEIIDVIKRSSDGSTYKLVCAADETVVLFDGVSDKDSAIGLVREAEPSHTALSHESLIGTVQKEFDGNTSALIYLVTDKSYAEYGNLEIISVGSANMENYGVFDLGYSHTGSKLTASVNAVSYISDADLVLKLVVDGKELSEKTVSVKAGEMTAATIEASVDSFSGFSVTVANKDGYALDNTVTEYNPQSDKSYSVLIVSETGFFFEAVIDALTDASVKVIDPEDYEKETEEYGLYIFDAYSPSELPSGSVWLVNCDKNIADSGFDVRSKNSLKTADVIEKSSSSATTARKLLEGVSGKDIYISKYLKYSGMYLKFTTLFSYEGNPLIFAGTNGVGNRQVVFGFDLHESDFALKSDFVVLLGNLIEYSFPSVVDKVRYTVGEDAVINILPTAEGYKAESPSGESIFVDIASATSNILLDEVGVYTVGATIAGKEVTYKIFAGADPEESAPVTEESDFTLSGERTEGGIDGKYDALILLFIILGALFVADWGVYCYEKYQLR